MDTNLNLDWTGVCPHDGVDINQKVWYRDLYQQRAVFVDNSPFYVFDRNDQLQSQFCAVQLVEAGLATAKDVCKAFGIASRTFSRIRKLVSEGGIAALVKQPRKGRRTSTEKQIPAIVRLYNDGKSSHEVARLLGISVSTVLRVLRDQGVPRRGNNGQPLFDKPQLPDDHNSDDDETSVDDAGANGDAKGNNDNHEQDDHEQDDHEQDDHEQDNHEQDNREYFPLVPGSAVDSAATATIPTVTAPASATPAPSSPTALDHETHTPVEATSIPYASPLDRVFMRFGLIDEAPVQFEPAESVSGAGALLGLALLEENGLLKEARSVYGSLRKCWYGLRPMIWTLLVMAWLRIKKPEQIKSYDPAGLGSLLGLPRTPEVKTIRRKMQEITDQGKAAELHRGMAKRRAEEHDGELFRLYIDGHVRVYYGQRRIGKTHVTRLNSWQRGETDYWVHMSEGHPLLVVRDASNGSFTRVMREQVLPEIRRAIGSRQVRVVFDRAGWCQELFQVLLDEGFDFMTYRCQPYEPLDESLLQPVTYPDGEEQVKYELAEASFEQEGWPPLRLIAVKRKDGGQTHIVASGRVTWEWMAEKAKKELAEAKLPMEEVKLQAEEVEPRAEEVELRAEEVEPRAEALAWGMFGRWKQENWFKYMMKEFDLDVLLEYTTEPDDADREVPNPAWRKLDKEVAAARKALQQCRATYAQRLLKQKQEKSKSDEKEVEESDCQSCGKCLSCKLKSGEGEIALLEKKYDELLKQRRVTPQRIRLGDVSERDAVKLSYERKLFSDTIKLSAYEIETRLYGLLRGMFVRREEEGRSLLRSIFSARGDLRVCGDVLEVHLEQLSSPRYTAAMISLCESVNGLKPTLDETNLRLRFHVKPRPIGE